MRVIQTVVLMAAALAVAAGGASAAPPSKMTPQARKAAIQKIVGNQRNFKQPRTMAEAARTEERAADGTVSVAVPLELWNNLSVAKDASGKLRMRESDGAAQEMNTDAEAPVHE